MRIRKMLISYVKLDYTLYSINYSITISRVYKGGIVSRQLVRVSEY